MYCKDRFQVCLSWKYYPNLIYSVMENIKRYPKTKFFSFWQQKQIQYVKTHFKLSQKWKSHEFKHMSTWFVAISRFKIWISSSKSFSLTWFNPSRSLEKTAYFSLESFCRTMLSLSRSLRSCLGALSTIATVRNQVSLLQLSKNGGRNGESVDICRNMSIAGDMKGWNL